MRIGEYLKERKVFLWINSVLLGLLVVFLLTLQVSVKVCIGIVLIWMMPLLSYMSIQFIVASKYYKELRETADQLEDKYLLAQLIDAPSFVEGAIFYDILKQTNKSMHERVNAYEAMQMEYKEYIEGWIHEIKTPIAGVKLIIENNREPLLIKIDEEIKQIEGFVEQALYYARSNEVYKDYIIKPFVLKQVILEVLKNNSRSMIQKGIFPDLGELDQVVYSDYKWIVFILNQVITNSIKYSDKPRSSLKITAVTERYKIVLRIEDEGMGISEKEIGRVFEKGFTGEKGRKYTQATGMGLYLCKKLCDKLGVGIQIASEVNKGTKVVLVFPLHETN